MWIQAGHEMSTRSHEEVYVPRYTRDILALERVYRRAFRERGCLQRRQSKLTGDQETRHRSRCAPSQRVRVVHRQWRHEGRLRTAGVQENAVMILAA